MKRDSVFVQMNKLGKKGQPFLFIIDFAMQQPVMLPLSEVNSEDILYSINGFSNAPPIKPLPKAVFFEKYPLAFAEYTPKFNFVKQQIQIGNSFLVNLTCPTPIATNLSLKEIFYLSRARYKLWYQDQFVVFSPEIFVQIRNNQIASFPMKGTIDAAIPNAEAIILNDLKETAEHHTIVDLIRNDLSIVARNVRVERLRYVEQVHTNGKNLLQVSSEIKGDLESNWQEQVGDILLRLLPAGSISGAPKPKTIDIIREAEQYERGYYTGVFGIFDGQELDCGVMIRFIEKTDQGLLYKSGGGITGFSEAQNEYQELVDKVYLPIQSKQAFRKSAASSFNS
ncbi:MAG: aminodeoxychorismate synthase component I [Saprospiraceae bacterium]|nr:aminodeoxychorismate synthase component I [Saprospiraceae bacterium]